MTQSEPRWRLAVSYTQGLGSRVLSASAGRWALALAGLALVVRLPFIFNDYSTSSSPDTVQYLELVDQLIAGTGFFDADLLRTAGYPLFVTPLSLLPGSTVDAVVPAQHVIGIALVVAVFLVADRNFGRIPAIYAGALVALAPSILVIEHRVLADLLYTVVIFAGAAALVEASVRRTPAVRMLVLTGVIFGLAVHVKPSGQLLLAVAPLVLAFSTRSWRATLRGTAIVTAVMVVVVAPWLIHNQVKYGHPVVSGIGGQTLFLRVFDQDKVQIPDHSPDARFVKRSYAEYVAGLTEAEAAQTTEGYSAITAALRERGFSTYEAHKLQGELALRAVLSHPRVYLKGTVRNVESYAQFNRSFAPGGGEATFHAAETSFGVLRHPFRAAAFAADLLARVGWTLSLAALASVLLLVTGSRRRRVAAATFFSMWVVLVVGGSMANWVEVRFAAQVALFQWILTGAAAWLVVSAIADRVRRHRSTETAVAGETRTTGDT